MSQGYRVSEEQVATVQLCIVWLEMAVHDYLFNAPKACVDSLIESAVKDVAKVRSRFGSKAKAQRKAAAVISDAVSAATWNVRNIRQSASAAECASEVLRRLIPGSKDSFRPAVNRWLSDLRAGTAEKCLFDLGIRPTPPIPVPVWIDRPLIKDSLEVATVEECARRLEEFAHQFVLRASVKNHDCWLRLEVEFNRFADDLRLLTETFSSRHDRNTKRVKQWFEQGCLGPQPELEAVRDADH